MVVGPLTWICSLISVKGITNGVNRALKVPATETSAVRPIALSPPNYRPPAMLPGHCELRLRAR